jgi:hypothetical protein
MTMFQKLYSIEGNQIEGSFKNLLNKVKEISELKIGMKASTYEEMLSFTNIAYTEDFIVGIVPYHKSSYNLEKFNYLKKYKNYNCVFAFFSNENCAYLRSELNGVPMRNDFIKSPYKYYNWFSNNEKWRLLFTSPNDFNDKDKRQNLVRELKNGSNLKVRIEMNGVNYILSPTIIYFNHKNNIQDHNVSIKTHPFVIFDNAQNIDNQEVFKSQELIANLNGEISILEYANFLTNTKINRNINIIGRVINFIFRKLKLKLKLINENEINCFNLTKKIEWFIQ